MMEKLHKAAEYISQRINNSPKIAFVLGSGLGFIADSIDSSIAIDYRDIPGFPVSTAPFHKGVLLSGTLSSVDVLVMQGRVHYYEGFDMHEVAFPIRVMKLLGIETVVLTCAVGAIGEGLKVGDIIMIKDHIKMFDDNPLRGANLDKFGPRFNDMTDAYTKRLQELAKKAAKDAGVLLKEGVYAYMPGPNYETPAEIRILRTLGADVVGMSTVPETIAASHAGMSVLGLAFCSNMAAGIDRPVTELEFGNTVKENLEKLILGILYLIRRENA